MSVPEALKRGLLLDASSLNRPEVEQRRLFRGAFTQQIPLYVGAPVYAEMQRRFRSLLGARFRPEVVDTFLQTNQIQILPFTREDADALVSWTSQILGGEDAPAREARWQAWKMRKAAAHLRPVLRRGLEQLSVSCDPQALHEALDAAAVVAFTDYEDRFPGTVDWLQVGMAHRRGLAIVTEEDTARELSEFHDYAPCYKLAEVCMLLPAES